MKIQFTGEFTVPDDALPDDIGSIDNWLGRFITNTAASAPEYDDLFDALKLKWSIAE